MKREEMVRIVKSELEHIPKGSKGSTQNRLRIYYNAWRRKDLLSGKSKEETLEKVVNKLKKDHPDFNPQFDEDFFKIPKRGPLQRLVGWIRR
ncbi:MAG: hypothetical protein AOA65_0179 [Candidatus Bathyarchaeota archaeon BA1]|nr:MAG: hypothetical protein AOA65_0179 [Candidatus Bathyarchaeota archaeon BA1]